MKKEKNPLAVFRADASPHIGGGHIMRCLTLADALSKAGWQCRFACTAETVETMPLLRECGYGIISPDELVDNAELLVVDHYMLDRDYEAGCRPWAKYILVIDDLANRTHDCDFLLDQTFGRAESDYKKLVPDHCKIMTGSNYALLRPQFSEARSEALQKRKNRAGRLENIFVMLSAGDEGNITGFILDTLEEVRQHFNIDIIMGARAQHLNAVQEQAKNSHHSMKVYSDISNVSHLMVMADLAIGAGGVASWERCALGLPALVIEAADNQKKVITELEKAGAIKRIESGKDILDFLENPEELLMMGSKAAFICDAQGVGRVLPYLVGAENNITLRVLSPDDSSVIYKWQKIPDMRRYFVNPSVPSREEHDQWIECRLNNTESPVYIICYAGKPVGVVRLDKKEGLEFDLSILIAPEKQGCGIGLAALHLVSNLIPVGVFYAEVHSENKASQSLFKRAGYKRTGDTSFILKK